MNEFQLQKGDKIWTPESSEDEKKTAVNATEEDEG